MPQQIKAIQTKYGELFGRDTIYLDNIHFDYQSNLLKLTGQINSSNLNDKHNIGKWLDFTCSFKAVYAMQMIELDSWMNIAPAEWYKAGSSFDEVLNSEWLLSLGGKIQVNKHHHFILASYDDVFQIICENVEFSIGT